MDTIERYFALAAADDVEAFVAQFTDDAVVVDDGHRRDDLRAWRRDTPDVTYTIDHVEGTHADVTIAGDFPGSPVGLHVAFGLADDGRIARLDIGPR
ncbi:nuclear transport factor 2 family protein [Actinomycetospora lutea]|uniref:nuclear transport factor 2 family protein n=1 Tax=Actinomycetospora lutea TaxID=663604 RepID=UPI002366366B|nr:nuclear transport factor 2 family protein [Actinomycetospora lutea]MDD7937880.1 nuclear transport factor 2 family protein [Actinomycetospora lutea]